jgi:hypothetical protein
MSKPERRFYSHDTKVGIVLDMPSQAAECEESKSAFVAIKRLFRRSGFIVTKDPRIEEHYKSLSRYHRLASHGDLWATIEYGGRCASVEFFQEIVKENPHGGRYDFGKRDKMPYLIRLRFEWMRRKIVAMLESKGYVHTPEKFTNYHADPLRAFNDSWDGDYEKSRGTHRFPRGEDGWPTDAELNLWTRLDGNGVKVSNGEIRYTLVNGRAERCKVYGGINGMWTAANGPSWRSMHAVNVGRLLSTFPGRGRHFDDAYRRKRVLQSLDKAIRNRNFKRAASISDYCDRVGMTVNVNDVTVASSGVAN